MNISSKLGHHASHVCGIIILASFILGQHNTIAWLTGSSQSGCNSEEPPTFPDSRLTLEIKGKKFLFI